MPLNKVTKSIYLSIYQIYLMVKLLFFYKDVFGIK